jgi:hypothetical protein
MRHFSDVRRQRERAGIRSLSPAKPARKMFHECASMIVRTTALCWRTAMRRADQRTKVSTPRVSRGQRPARPRPPGSRLLHSGQELPPLWRARPLAARSSGRCLGMIRGLESKIPGTHRVLKAAAAKASLSSCRVRPVTVS